MWNLRMDHMSEKINSKNISKIEPSHPILKLVYDADKDKVTAPPVKERQPRRMVSFMNAFADSIDNDIRTILEY